MEFEDDSPAEAAGDMEPGGAEGRNAADGGGTSAETVTQDLVDHLADGVVVVDAEDGTVRFANRAAQDLFGRGAAELEGRAFGFPLVAGETSDLHIERPGRPAGVAEVRVTATSWEGREALLVSLREVTDRRRSERRARDLVREQTARREAEVSARHSRFLSEASRALAGARQLPDVLEALAELATSVGDLAVAEVLQGGPQLPGLRVVRARDEVADPRAVDRLAALDVPGLLPALGAQLRSGGTLLRVRGVSRSWLRENTADRVTAEALEGLDPRSLVAAPVPTGGSVLAVLYLFSLQGGRRPHSWDAATVEELAGRAGLALENVRLLRVARHASRAKSDFLNVISHELRTPLTAIVGYSGLLQDGLAGPLTEGQIEYLRGIDRNSDSLLRVIDQILLFADTEADRERVVYRMERLEDLVHDVVAVARPLAEREGLRFEVEPPAADAEAPLDSAKVRQILLHLLANAVKFTREGYVRLAVALEPGMLRLDVEDSGIGIPEADRERIFEAFTQVEPSPTRRFGGTGLGLNLVRNLVHLMGGRVDVGSEVGRGSIFSVRLPVPEWAPEKGASE